MNVILEKISHLNLIVEKMDYVMKMNLNTTPKIQGILMVIILFIKRGRMIIVFQMEQKGMLLHIHI